MGLAALVAAFEEERGYDALAPVSRGSNAAITFPLTPLGLKAEFLLGGQWYNAIGGPNGVAYEPRIRIRRGRASESSRAQPSQCKLRLKNPDRLWSPRNWQSPFYGKLSRNIQMRITVNPGDRDYVRFNGFVSALPQEWTMGGHRWVEIEANGILRRLGQGKAPLNAPIYRAMTAQKPYAYWPMTDVAGSTEAASAVTGIVGLTPTGNGAFSGTTNVPDGTGAYLVNAGRLSTTLTPVAGTTTGWVVGFALRDQRVASDVDSFRPILSLTTNVDAIKYIQVQPAQVTGAPLYLVITNATGTVISSMPLGAFPVPAGYNDQWRYYQIQFKLNGANGDMYSFTNGSMISTLPFTLGSPTAGSPTVITVNDTARDFSTYGVALSNLSVVYRTTIAYSTGGLVYLDSDAYRGYSGESPMSRYRRLNIEEGVPYTVVETDPDTETMGPQGIKPHMDLIRECEATNEGVLDETFMGEMRLISRTAFWNQPPSMVVDYTSGAIQSGQELTDDDLDTRNDWTITRDGGNSRQVVQTSGPLNINSPVDDPQGVYKYDDSATLSLQTDLQPLQHAAWKVSKGTVDKIRVAKMPLHFSQSPELLASWLKMDLADTSRFQITNPPLDVGGLTLDQIMTGYEEIIDMLEWRADISGVPAWLYEQIGMLDTGGFLDCYASYLTADPGTAGTAINLQINDQCRWFHDDGDYRINVRDEEMIVTAVGVPTGVSGNYQQTLTVIRSANGVVLAHPIGTQVLITDPFVFAL